MIKKYEDMGRRGVGHSGANKLCLASLKKKKEHLLRCINVSNDNILLVGYA